MRDLAGEASRSARTGTPVYRPTGPVWAHVEDGWLGGTRKRGVPGSTGGPSWGTNLGDQSGGPVWRSRCSREWFPTRVVLNGSGFRDGDETSRENLPGVLGGRVSWGKHRAGGIESGPSSALSIRFWALLRIVASVSGFGQRLRTAAVSNRGSRPWHRITASDDGFEQRPRITASGDGLGRWIRVVAGVVAAGGRDETTSVTDLRCQDETAGGRDPP